MQLRIGIDARNLVKRGNTALGKTWYCRLAGYLGWDYGHMHVQGQTAAWLSTEYVRLYVGEKGVILRTVATVTIGSVRQLRTLTSSGII